MNPVEWHFLWVHLPGTAALFGLFLVCAGLIFKNRDFQRAGLSLFVLGGLFAAPAYLTGQPAMDYLKGLKPTMPTEPAELHSELAVLALGASILLGLFAAGVLFWARRGEALRRWMLAVSMAGALLASFMMIYTSHAGGKIQHPEIRRNV